MDIVNELRSISVQDKNSCPFHDDVDEYCMLKLMQGCPDEDCTGDPTEILAHSIHYATCPLCEITGDGGVKFTSLTVEIGKEIKQQVIDTVRDANLTADQVKQLADERKG